MTAWSRRLAPKGLVALSTALALAACAVGPDYKPPPVAPTAAARFASGSEPVYSVAAPPADWWRLFEDPALDALIGQALTANTDLRVAAANLAQARGALEQARAGRFPTTTLSGAASYERPSSAGLGASIPAAGGSAQPFPDSQFYDASLDVSYEVDLFGRVSRSIEAARGDARAQAAAVDYLRTTIVSETARAYVDACAYAEQLAVARRTLAVQQQSADLTRTLLVGGRETALSVAQAQAQVETIRATLPTLEGQRRSALFQLAVLTGRPPSEISPAADACKTPPKVRSLIPIGDGAGLIRRRPDVRQADRQLAAAVARIGLATAALYPTVTLGGSVGTSAARLKDLTSDTAFNFNVGPAISWSFPNILVARAQIRQAQAGADSALANFDRSVLNALQEAELALTAYARELDRNAALRAAQFQAGRALALSRQQFTAGTTAFLTVLVAEQTLANADAGAAQSDTALAEDQIAVFKALGGGWENAPPVGGARPYEARTRR